MVVYAQDQVTLQVLESFTGAYTYYRAMPAGSSAPPAPTTETPDPAQWSSTEPAFNPGTTTVLYTVTKNTFGPSKYQYSAVSLSASYEAAKQAYSKAINADNSTIKDVVAQYAQHTSATTPPAVGYAGWGNTAPTPTAGVYVWIRFKFTDGQGTVTYSTPSNISGLTGAQGNQGIQGPPGIPGTNGYSITSAVAYFKKASPSATPAKPTTATPDSTWKVKEEDVGYDPDTAADYVVYRCDKFSYSNGAFAWSDVLRATTFMQAQDAALLAGRASQASNITQANVNGMMWFGANEPPEEIKRPNMLWYQTMTVNVQGENKSILMGLKQLINHDTPEESWEPYTIFADMIIIPDEYGKPTILTGGESYVKTILTDSIKVGEIDDNAVNAEALAPEAVGPSNLDSSLKVFKETTDKWNSQVAITEAAISIARQKGTERTELKLEAGKLSFKVNNVEGASLTPSLMKIQNVEVLGSLKVGKHLVQNPTGTDVTNFVWKAS